MNGFNHAISANETAMNSQGSALRENARYMESIEAKVNALDAAFEKLSTEVAPTSIIKVGLDILIGLFKVMSTEVGSGATQFVLLSGTMLGLGTIAVNVGSKIFGMVQAFVAGNTAAMALNPMLLALSVTFGLVAMGAIKAQEGLEDYHNWQKECTKGATDLKDAIDQSNKTYDDSTDKITATSEAAKGWLKRVEELTNKTHLNSNEQYELNELVKRLNENIPDLGIEIDEITGKIKGETTEIYNQIEAWKKLAVQQGLSDKISAQSSALAEAQIGQQSKVLERKDLMAKYGLNQSDVRELLSYYESSNEATIGQPAKWDLGGAIYRALTGKSSTSDLAKKFGMKDDEVFDVAKQLFGLTQSISSYETEIKKAEDGLNQLERLADSMKSTEERAEEAFGGKTPDIAPRGGLGGGTTGGGTSEAGRTAEATTGALDSSFDKQYKALKHQLTMDYIAEEDYYDSLEKLYQKFYTKGSEDYQKYEEEVYKGRKKLAEDEASAQAKAQSEAEKAAEKAQQAAEKAAKEAAQKAEDEEKAAKQAYEKAFDDQLDLLDHKLAMDEITEDEYYKSLDALNQKFFKNKEEYLDKYWKYEEKIYAYRKKLAEQEQKEQEKALEEFKKLQEERIKSLRDEVEAYNDLIKEQLDALKSTEDAINDKYDAEIAKIEETNKALEDQIEYEKLLEEMAKAKNTRKLVYTEEGYKYVEDTDAIASAQSKIDAYNKNKQIEAQKQALAWDRDLQLGAVADRRSALEAQQERWSNLSSLLGGVNSSMSDVDIIELMKSNSASWHETSNTDEQAKLHEANLILNELLSNKGSFSSSSGRWSMYADGTTSAMGGLSLVGERGAELRVLNHGDGIIPNGLTQNLMAWGKINPEAIMSNLGGMFGGGSTNINVSNITLPNVSNAQEFLSGLESLAKQYAFQRG